MAFKWDPKDPTDISVFSFDFGSVNLPLTKRSLPAAVTILTYTVTVETGLTKVADGLADTNKTVTFKVSGGTAEHVCVPGVTFPIQLLGLPGYAVTCVINTSDGQTFEVTKLLQVKERIAP